MTTGAVSPLVPSQRYITIAAVGFVPTPSPGVCVIRNAGRPLRIDRRDGYGFDGGRLTTLGTKINDFEVEIRIWEAEHWIQWELFELAMEPPKLVPGVPSFSLGIGHPILKAIKITNVVLEDPGAWEPGETGDWYRTLKFVVQQTPVLAGAAVLQGPPPTGPTVVPLTAQQKINAKLDAENAELRAKAGAG